MKDKTFQKAEIFEAVKKYFNGDELAADVWIGKYALTDKDGNFLEKTPEDTHRRLAKEYARIESKYKNPVSEEKIFNALDKFYWIVAQGSPMSGIGNDYFIQSIQNCFTAPSPLDSYGGILEADQQIAQISKRRGGIGMDISKIRHKKSPTRNAAKSSDGIGVFMKRFSNTTGEVAQSGRRGALMMTISCHHPEIETFINIKRTKKDVTNANISIRWTDEFLQAVVDDAEVQLRFPVEKDVPHQFKKMVKARTIWDQFIQAVWESAEPGCLFWDTITRWTPSEVFPGFEAVSTNPCSEIILNAYGSCNLMLLNLNSFVKNPFTPEAFFDFSSLRGYAKLAQRLLDDQVDLEMEKIDKILDKIESDPEPLKIKSSEKELWLNIKKWLSAGRRTGLGVTALGDVIAKLGLSYGGDDSILLVEEIYKNICLSAYESSVELARERGAFPAYDDKLNQKSEFVQRIFAASPSLKREHDKYGRRNIAIMTTAPAGSVSILCQTTSGCEPAIYLKGKRRRKIPKKELNDIDSGEITTDEFGQDWLTYDIEHPGFLSWKAITGKSKVEESPYHGSLAKEIDWSGGIKLQAAAQRWICHAISRTCNLPKGAAKEQIGEIYMNAWAQGLKGITVYREGSIEPILFEGIENKFKKTEAIKRPQNLSCEIHRATIRGEQWLIIVGLMDGKPYEIFAGLAAMIEIPERYKTGVLEKKNFKSRSKYNLLFGEKLDIKIKDISRTFDNPEHSILTRMISLSLRHGASPSFVVEQLNRSDESDFTSFNKVAARVMKKYIKNGERVRGSEKKCLACGSNLVYSEGCVLCPGCGASKCS